MTKSNPTVVNFIKVKETKGTFCYQEIDGKGEHISGQDGAVVGSLYVRKAALKNGVPERLQVSIVAL